MDELKHLDKVFKQNGYPTIVVHRVLYRPPNQSRSEPAYEEESRTKKMLFLPYVKGVNREGMPPTEREDSFQISWHTQAGTDEGEEQKASGAQKGRGI